MKKLCLLSIGFLMLLLNKPAFALIAAIEFEAADSNYHRFVISGKGTNSNQSDIVADDAFSYTSNIDYSLYQGDPISNTSVSRSVMRFLIRDGGAAASDPDDASTELTAITFNAAHIDNIRSAALFDGNALIDNSPVINTVAGTIAFSGLGGARVTALDGGARSVTLRVSFLAAVTDNEQLEFAVASATANDLGSVFADPDGGGAKSSTTGDRNRIEVSAAQLHFIQQPSAASANAVMWPAVTVGGVDGNNNLDLDWSENVTITSTGTMTGDPVTVAATGGFAEFSGIVHTVAGTGLALTAGHAGFSPVVSNLFDITIFGFSAGDYRPLSDFADLSWNGSWERFDGANWSSAVPAPQHNIPGVNRILVDKAGITGGRSASNTYNADILVLANGELIFTDDDDPPVAAELLSAGNTVEVREGGRLVIRGDADLPATANLVIRDGGELVIDQPSMTNEHPIWDGVELFEGNSTLTINDWDFTAPAVNRSLINAFVAIDDNANGYKFGHVVFDASPTDDWTIVGGPVNVRVCEGDFTVINPSSHHINIMTDTTDSISSTFGGNLIVRDGDFSFTGSCDNGDFNQAVHILGDFVNTSDDSLWLHRNNLNMPNSVHSDVWIAGDVTIDGPAVFASDQAASATYCELHLNTADSQYVHIAPPISQVDFTVEPGAFVLLKNECLKFAGNATWETQGGATLHFNFDAANDPLYFESVLGGGNAFKHRTGAYVYITDPGGLWTTKSAIGNLRQFSASNVSIANSSSTFHYIAKAGQQTGDCHTAGSTTKRIIVELADNTHELTLTATTGTSDELKVVSGIFAETDASYIYGGGKLTMSGGGFRTAVLTSTGTVPQLTGDYSISGGFVELNAPGGQELRGSSTTKPNYHDLIISGSNLFGVNEKTVTSAINVDNRVTITGAPVFDIRNNGMAGTAGLTMDGGWLRMSKLNTSLPELDGSATAYNITGGTIEWYGSGSAQQQLVRGVDAYLNTITYHHIELNADAANTVTANIDLAEGIVIAGTMNVNSPTVFQMDNTDHVDGSGSFFVGSGATFKYGDPFGITLGNSTEQSAGAIRTGSSRTIANFPSDASYGWVSTGDMVTGNGLPPTFVNGYLQRSLTSDDVTLSGHMEIRGTLDMDRGNIIAGNHLVCLGNSAEQPGILDYDATNEPFIVGGMIRWFGDGTNAGYSTGLFPLGVREPASEDIYNRFCLVEYRTPKIAGGTLGLAFFEIPMGRAGLPISGIPAAGSCSGFDLTSTTDEGYWSIFENNGISGGSYDITCTGEGFRTVADICQLSLVKRVGAGNWFDHGLHAEPYYLDAPGMAKPTAQRTSAKGWSNYGFGGGPNNPLPVELAHFEAVVSGSDIMVRWTTVSEINSDYFEVLHSVDGMLYDPVGYLEGRGTTAEVQHYDFLHENPSTGRNYYRLRMVDFDGSEQYSEIKTVFFEVQEMFEVVSTQAVDILDVRVSGGSGRSSELTIFNMSGQVVFRKSLKALPASSTISIDVSNLPAAVYVIQWHDGLFPLEKKFIKF
jgi:hypothetical protein